MVWIALCQGRGGSKKHYHLAGCKYLPGARSVKTIQLHKLAGFRKPCSWCHGTAKSSRGVTRPNYRWALTAPC